MLLQHGFQLLAAALAQAGQALALAHEQHQQRQCQPATRAGGRGPAAVGHAAVGFVHQVQLPGRAGQRLGVPQHAAGQGGHVVRGLQAHQAAAVVQAVVHADVEGAQGLVGVLPRGVQLAALLVVQRLQQAVAPDVLAGQKDHAVRIGGQHDVGRLQPFALQLLQRDLDGHQAQRAPVFIANGLRQEVARLARGHANAVEAAAPLRQRLLHIGAEAVVHAPVAGGGAPVAGIDGQPVAVEQGEGGGLAGAVGLLQLAVELRHLVRAQGAAQRVLQLHVQGQHLGQGAVAVDALGQRLPVQGQLALHALAFVVQRPLPGPLPGHEHAGRCACKQDEQGPELAKAGRGHGKNGVLKPVGCRWGVCRTRSGGSRG